MRYISSFNTSMPMFLIPIIWGAVGLPVLWIALAFLPSVVVGFALGRYSSRVMETSLFTGESHFLFRRAPGGIWFFVGLGVFGGCAGGILAATPPMGLLILRVSAIVLGVLFSVMFGIIAIAVMRLERAEGKHIYMMPAGFCFIE